jgi:outer membrane immunogenic protein
MKFRLLAGAAIAAIMAGSAFAADMPLKAPPPVLAYDWSGFYIGGFVGGGWMHVDSSDPGYGVVGTLINFPVVQTTTGSAFIGGIEGGDRYQFGKLVVGWEADWAWGNINGTSTSSFGPPPIGPLTVNFNRVLNQTVKWTGTATSSVGIAHDRWLIYGKAGVAWAHLDDTDNSIVNVTLGPLAATTPFFSGLGGADRVGWTVGTGIEWAIWNNWSIKAEYDFIDFGNGKTTQVNGTVLPALGGGLPVAVGLQDNLHVQQAKFGINWHIMPNIW